MNKYFLLSLIFTMCFSANLFAQGKVKIKQDKKVKKLVNQDIHFNEKEEEIDGFKIQLISSTDRSKVLLVKANFIQKFSGIKATLEYEQPYFKLRVGNFLDKLTAYRYKMRFQGDFPSAFVVKSDEVKKDKIILN